MLNIIWANIARTRHIVLMFTVEKNQTKSIHKCILNFKWRVSILYSLCGIHECFGTVHFITFSWLLLTTGSRPGLLSSTTTNRIRYLTGNFDFLISENNFWYQKIIRNYFWYQKLFSASRKSWHFLISENNFWYPKIIFWCQKLIFWNWISDIRKKKFLQKITHFLLAEVDFLYIKRLFSDIRKNHTFSDVRNWFLILENHFFDITKS